MRAPAFALALLALPSLADARPFTAGVGLGMTQAKADAGTGAAPNDTLGLFGRLGLTARLSAQLELQRIQTDNQSVDIRTGTGLLILDLGSGSRVMPMLLGGFGLDDATPTYGQGASATHFEAGFALEYRADGGLTIGADVRIGDRNVVPSQMVYPLAGNGVALYAPSTLQDGEYRSARLTAGIRF